MITVDSYSTNGNVHKTCEDYSLHSEYPLEHVIICDGCSSSRFTDVGARLLAHTAQKVLLDRISKEFNDVDEPEVFMQYFRGQVIYEISKVLDLLELNSECLDSTLLVSFIKHNMIHTYLFGDGQVLIIYKSGDEELKTISYKGNAPYYLSYQMLINREKNRVFKSFAKNSEEPLLTRYEEIIRKKQGIYSVETKSTLYSDFFIDPIPLDNILFYLIMSDGTESFINRSNGERVSYQKIVEEFSSFKNTNGEFIKRRVRRAIEDFAKENIYNTDDVSVAGFYFSD